MLEPGTWVVQQWFVVLQHRRCRCASVKSSVPGAMVRLCAFPSCGNKMSRDSARSFHRLPLSDVETRGLWLQALGMDVNTPVEALRLADHRVCSDHFACDDYSEPKRKRKAPPKHVFLKRNAVPRVGRPAAHTEEVMLLMAEVWTWTQSHDTQEQGRSKAGARQEQGRSKAGARQEQGRSKAGARQEYNKQTL